MKNPKDSMLGPWPGQTKKTVVVLVWLAELTTVMEWLRSPSYASDKNQVYLLFTNHTTLN